MNSEELFSNLIWTLVLARSFFLLSLPYVCAMSSILMFPAPLLTGDPNFAMKKKLNNKSEFQFKYVVSSSRAELLLHNSYNLTYSLQDSFTFSCGVFKSNCLRRFSCFPEVHQSKKGGEKNEEEKIENKRYQEQPLCLNPPFLDKHDHYWVVKNLGELVINGQNKLLYHYFRCVL